MKVVTLVENPNEDSRSRNGTLVRVATMYKNSDDGTRSRRALLLKTVILAEKRHFRR